MWNNWSDVKKKIKEIATDITTPQYEDYHNHEINDEDKEEAEESHHIRSRNENGLPPPPSSSGVARQLYHDHDHVRHESTVVPTRRMAPVSDAMPPTRSTFASKETKPDEPPICNATPSSVDGANDSTKKSGGEDSFVTQSTRTSLHTDTQGETKAFASAPLISTSSSQGEAEIIELKKQVRQLLDEKQSMETQILARRTEEKDAHDKLVSHYEGLIKSLRDESSAGKTESEQLKRELENRETECETLKAQLQQMRLQVEELEKAAAASAASRDSACAALTGRIEELQQQLAVFVKRAEQQGDRSPLEEQANIPDAQTERTDATALHELRLADVSDSNEITELDHTAANVEVTRSDATHTKDDTLALQNEVKMLHSQLKAAKEEVIHAVERERERGKQEFQSLETELDSLRRESAEDCKVRERLVEELKELRANTAATISEAATREANLTEKLCEADETIEELRNKVADFQRSGEQRESEGVSVAALAARCRELEAESAHLHSLLQQLEHTVTDSLVRADVELPVSIKTKGGNGKSDGESTVVSSFLDKVTILASELNRLFDAGQQAEKLEKEWEYTYEQARSVNAALNQQMSEAWKTIGSLREELSIREHSLAKVKQQLQAENQQHTSALQTITIVTNELQALKEEKHAWETRIFESTSGAANQESRLAEMAAEMDMVRTALQDRDDELTQAKGALDNLQQVLDAFKLNKSRDVESRTADMQIEIDDVKAQLAEAQQSQEKHHVEIDALNTAHRKEIAAKNVEIMAFHRKHAELCKALEETARQLNGDMIIDKRVISHLVVNYIHAFVGQRPEANEMLKVLSGLLNWDESMQEKAGLLPGPSNPKANQQARRGIIKGLVSTVWGNSRATQNGTDGATSAGAAENARPSLAELWVEFLMRESETSTGPFNGISSAQDKTVDAVDEKDAKEDSV